MYRNTKRKKQWDPAPTNDQPCVTSHDDLARAIVPVGYRLTGHGLVMDHLIRCSPTATLVEARWSARSRRPGWSAAALRNHYGERYIELGYLLGNTAYREPGVIQIAQLEQGVARLLELLERGKSPLILLCACRDYAQCHRRVICEAVQQVDQRVKIWQPEQVWPWLCRQVW
ncbi:MAG: DUF488 family protein [Acidobacterium ailaaui]|nr:DUF488 family protein [Pseudacidobacterium ailaaui]